jgi:hypothetical protein
MLGFAFLGAVAWAQTQSAPAASNPPAQTAPAPEAPAPSGAQAFPFPEDDSKTKELPGAHAPVTPDVPAAPNAPAPNTPAPADGANAHPYPGDSAPAAAPGGYSSSGGNAPGNPAAGSVPDAPTRHKLALHDEGSTGHIDTARADKDAQVADFYIKDGNYAGAYLRYKDAVVFDPDNADAHFRLAEMARKTGKPSTEVIEQYNAALKLDPQGKHVKEARKALAELQASAAKK